MFGSLNKLPNCYYMLQKMTCVRVRVCACGRRSPTVGSPRLNAVFVCSVLELGVLRNQTLQVEAVRR